MARTIATITGTALKPGVSRNGRWYKPEHVTEAVRLAQERLASGQKPMVMLTFHGADDNSREIAASLTGMSLAEDGSAEFSAGFADTPAGWDIAKLADTTDGKPAHLKNVSIRGAWTGRVRKERGPDGRLVETADGVELDGLDFTKSPGVAGAEIKTFAWAGGGATETDGRVLITESVEEALVTAITEEAPDAPAVPDGVREALQAVFGEAATVPMSKRGSGIKGGGGTPYADPGYQADGKQRYELDTPAHIRAAWAYINQEKNTKPYDRQQVKRIKNRIRLAAQKAGIKITTEGWIVGPALEVTEAVAEYAGLDPDSCGSYSLSATNGPTTVTVCSYGLDPADLHVILAQACSAASAALCSIDPDMDGDIDVPGADAEDTDSDADQMDNGDGTQDLVRRLMSAIRGESDENLEDLLAEMRQADSTVTETAPEDPAPDPAAADRETEVPAMGETTTTETAATAPASLTQADVAAVVAQALAADKAARKAAKKAKASESAPVATVTETDEQRIDRIVSERLAAERAAAAVTETDEQRIGRLVEERLVRERQQLAAQGLGPGRKGLVTETAADTDGLPANFPMREGRMLPMEQWTEEQRAAVGATLQTHVLGAKAVY